MRTASFSKFPCLSECHANQYQPSHRATTALTAFMYIMAAFHQNLTTFTSCFFIYVACVALFVNPNLLFVNHGKWMMKVRLNRRAERKGWAFGQRKGLSTCSSIWVCGQSSPGPSFLPLLHTLTTLQCPPHHCFVVLLQQNRGRGKRKCE